MRPVTSPRSCSVVRAQERGAHPRAAPPLPAQSCTPIIKWAGGKQRLLVELQRRLPWDWNARRYVEPFFGAGALFFHLQPPAAALCDLNDALLRTYRLVRADWRAVAEHLERLALAHDAERYYRVRSRFNAERSTLPEAELAASFIYLNRTCFNGLFRVNRRGDFNVPIGRYARPRIVDRYALERASQALQSASLSHGDFETALASCSGGEFVYLDPPYEPVSQSSSFTQYTQHGFGQHDQMRLQRAANRLSRMGCRVLLSSSDTPFIRQLYRDWRLQTVDVRRSVSCSVRRSVSELMIRNY